MVLLTPVWNWPSKELTCFVLDAKPRGYWSKKKLTVFGVRTYKYLVSDRPILFNSTSKYHKLDLVEVIRAVFKNITHNPYILRETFGIIRIL